MIYSQDLKNPRGCRMFSNTSCLNRLPIAILSLPECLVLCRTAGSNCSVVLEPRDVRRMTVPQGFPKTGSRPTETESIWKDNEVRNVIHLRDSRPNNVFIFSGNPSALNPETLVHEPDFFHKTSHVFEDNSSGKPRAAQIRGAVLGCL